MIQAVLFDLDGTLLDTAPDMLYALNRLRQERGLGDLPLTVARPYINLGSKKLLELALNIDVTHKDFNHLRERFLDLYQIHLPDNTPLFPNF